MVVRRAVTVVVALASALMVLSGPADAQTAARACQVGPTLVDVVYRFANDQALNSEGEVFALASGTGRFRLWRTGPDTFCAISTSVGTFTTFAGPSPAGTGTVPAGHTGYVAGESVLRFIGTFAPTLPTRGFVGSFDARCDQFDCATPIQFGRFYVDVQGPPELLAFRFVHVSTCGAWVETESTDIGDIACG
jgi:hypothetical protein